ncbi:MAG TPA: response regulator [Thermoguttaceae bacterium]|nr:response regulator [Thermoguttaceae bacterium]
MIRVLVVDDEPAYCESLRLLLSCEGFAVFTAANAQEALDVGADYPIDLLVVDWILRDQMDGVDVAAALQAANPRMQVIVISGWPSGELEARVEALPFAQCLHKPFAGEAILSAAHEATALDVEP